MRRDKGVERRTLTEYTWKKEETQRQDTEALKKKSKPNDKKTSRKGLWGVETKGNRQALLRSAKGDWIFEEASARLSIGEIAR